jgi:chorismate lyase / 3-hydroxybenzoate synthase
MMAKWDAKTAAAGTCLELPAWVEKLIGDCHPCLKTTHQIDQFTDCAVRDAGNLLLATFTVRAADVLDPLSFQRQTVVAYRALALVLRERKARHPIRFWNFIPDINKSIDDSISRYMVFNAGRYSAFHEWYGESKSFEHDIATASGVGHSSPDLVIHCLSSSNSGRAVENPRQIPSYRYSAQFGPLPPTFARATAVQLNSDELSLLLVGGTASIRGEESLHVGDLRAQANETLHNLAAVVRASHALVGDDQFVQQGCDSAWLQRFRSLRVYHPRMADRSVIAEVLANRCPNVAQIEWRQADLCRPELLIEMEGVAERPRLETEVAVVIPVHRQRAALEA